MNIRRNIQDCQIPHVLEQPHRPAVFIFGLRGIPHGGSWKQQASFVKDESLVADLYNSLRDVAAVEEMIISTLAQYFRRIQ